MTSTQDAVTMEPGAATPAADSSTRTAQQLAFLQDRLQRLYGDHPDFSAWFAQLMADVRRLSLERSPALQALDLQRLREPGWFQSSQMLAYSAYVDRFAGTLTGVSGRIPYLRELGVTCLHLLPFLKARADINDGGFAVASYEEVEPRLGSMQDLSDLTAALRASGISLCADFVLNHVSDEHPWAIAARGGDRHYQAYFHIIRDPATVAALEYDLGQIFPQTAPGNFSPVPALEASVWTTFYPYQWDLNYANPAVFAEMVLALLRLANRGVEIFRLDSTAFLWKQAGTRCMNLPQVHWILQAIRSIMDMAAPGVLLMAEAIVPTRDLPPYFGLDEARGRECHMAYHSSLMSAAWFCMAEQNAELLRAVIQATPTLPSPAAWLTYVRCHDDIGWNVLRPELEKMGDARCERLGPVARFFAGDRPGSFASGLSFQADDSVAVHGTNGMTAALVGLAADQDAAARQHALRRMLLLYGLAMSVGGLPLIYMGDELGMGNAPWDAHTARPGTDSRQVHRPVLDVAALEQRHDPLHPAHAVYAGLRRLTTTRAMLPELAADASLQLLPTGPAAVLALQRGSDFVALFNFSAAPATVALGALRRRLSAWTWHDVIDNVPAADDIVLQAWDMRWLQARD